MFETFEWEETDGAEANSPSIGSASSAWVTYHTNTRPPGQEALLVDTGAVHNLTGQDSIERQTQAAMKHGLKTTWNRIPGKGNKFSGIGESAKTATQTATVYGVLANGDSIQYEAPVIPPGELGETSPAPPLYVLDSMTKENVAMNMRTSLMFFPQGEPVRRRTSNSRRAHATDNASRLRRDLGHCPSHTGPNSNRRKESRCSSRMPSDKLWAASL